MTDKKVDKNENIENCAVNRNISLESASTMKDLECVSQIKQKEFFDSFDTVLIDLDGVVWVKYQILPGNLNCIKSLRKLDKKVHYVTNNSTIAFDTIFQLLKKDGLIENEDDLCFSSRAIISYLKSINFNKEVFVIAQDVFKDEIRKAGFIVNEEINNKITTIPDLKTCFIDNENIGAVITDIDFNFNYFKLQKAITYLKRSDVLFLSGALDVKAPFGDNDWIIGPHYMYQPIKDLSGRKSMLFGKPGTRLSDYIVKKFNIKDKSRILMIGDTINEDMGFATNSGYRKLLVLTGNTKLDLIKNWQSSEQLKPNYYIESLAALDKVIKAL